jgi:hypothetical protein
MSTAAAIRAHEIRKYRKKVEELAREALDLEASWELKRLAEERRISRQLKEHARRLGQIEDDLKVLKKSMRGLTQTKGP